MISANRPILLTVIVTAILGLGIAVPDVYARNLSDTQRYDDGFNDGTQAAIADRQNGNQFNAACDPTGAHTSDGQHTTIYCTGWANGYTSTWNGNSGSQGGSPQNGNDGGGLLNKGFNFCKHNLVACLTIGKSLLGLG